MDRKSKLEIVNRLRDPNEQADAYTSTLCEDAADTIENLSGLLKESYEEDARKYKEIKRVREALKKISKTEPESDGNGDWYHMIIARAALKESKK